MADVSSVNQTPSSPWRGKARVVFIMTNRILLVCLACRSPTAEGVLRSLAGANSRACRCTSILPALLTTMWENRRTGAP